MIPRRGTGVGTALDGVAEAGLIGLLLLAPLPFGSVQPAAVLTVVLWSAMLSLLVLPRASSASSPVLTPGWLLGLGAVFSIGVLQVLPLSPALARLLSPASAGLQASIPGADPQSSIHVSVHAGATREYLARLAAFAAVFVVSATLASRRGACQRILLAIFGAGLFQATYGSVEYLSGHQHIFAYAKRFYTDSATGTYINQNHYAGALEMSLLVGLGLLLARLRRHVPSRRHATVRQRLASFFDGEGGRTLSLITAIAVVALGLVLSYSRSGLAFGAVASLAVVGFDLRVHGERRMALPVFLLGGAVLGLISLVGWDRVTSDLSRQMGDLGFEGGRVRVWRDSLAVLGDYPLLGTGWGTFRDIYPLYRHESIRLTYDHAHNDYIQALVETGILGGAALTLLLSLFCWTLYKGLSRYQRPDLPLLLGAAGAIGSLLLHEGTDFNLQIPANALLFSALAGALLGGLKERPADGGDAVVRFDPNALRRKRGG